MLNTKAKQPTPKFDGMSTNGNPQFLLTARAGLLELVVGSIYNSGNVSADTRRTEYINQLVDAGDSGYIANLAVYARTVIGMRSMPLVLVVEWIKSLRDSGQQYQGARQVVTDVIQRADEIMELMAYARSVFNPTPTGKGDTNLIPKSIKRGVRDAFFKFSPYQFAKYTGSGKVMKMSDVIRIVHPKPLNDEMAALFKGIRHDTLTPPDTWEVALSTNTGDEAQSKTAVWEDLIDRDVLGYMAMIRNLRNMVQAGISTAHLKKVSAIIRSEANVAKSKMLPFQFVSAYDMLVAASAPAYMQEAVSQALEHSFANLKQLGERVWVILDISGSMSSQIPSTGAASYSKMTSRPIDHAALFTAALLKSQTRHGADVALTVFADVYRTRVAKIGHDVSVGDSLISIRRQLINMANGGGTRLDLGIKTYPDIGMVPDVVLLLSDMQVDNYQFSGYGKLIDQYVPKGTHKFAFNFNTNGSTPVGEIDGWVQLAGWSPRIFDLLGCQRATGQVMDVLTQSYLGLDTIKTLGMPVADDVDA